MNTNSLSTGIYSIPQAARLLGVPQYRVRGWVRGYYHMVADPIVQSELPTLGNRLAFTFVNLIEMRFIAAFSKYGVQVRSIRHMAVEAKRILNHPHPFATNMIFRTDGRGIFIESAELSGDPALYDLRKKNWAMHPVLSGALKKDVLYSEAGVANAWYPKKELAPEVIVHPKIAFGQPALDDSGIPTEALFDAFLAERKNYSRVARWFGLPVRRVKEAVMFESELRAVH